MKIRTIDELQDYVDKEMSWRRKELSAIKSNIFVAKEFAKNTALRSGIAILYAHWEGMVKNIATAYLSFVANQRLQYKELKNNFWSIAIKNDLLGFDETRKSSRHNKIIKNIRNMEDKRAHIPYEDVIKTKSNLNSDVFIEIMETIGLDYSQYEGNFKLLDEVLLKMRNEIAHGEKPEYIDLDQDRFNEVYDKIVDMMNMFSTQIMNAACLKEYKQNRN